MKEHWTRRTLLKLTAAPLLAPLAAACAPPTPEVSVPSPKLTQEPTKPTPQLAAEKQNPNPTEIPVNVRAILPAEFIKATEEAMKQKAQASPTRVEPSPTSKPPARPTVVVRELTPSPKKEEKQESMPHVLWTQKTLMESALANQAFIADSEKVLLFNLNNQLEAHSLSTAKTIWNLNQEWVPYCWSVQASAQSDPLKIFFLGCQNNLFYAVDAQTGKFKWTLDLAKLKTSSSIPSPNNPTEGGFILTNYIDSKPPKQISILLDIENGQKIFETEGNITYTHVTSDIAVVRYQDNRKIDVWNLSTRQFRREVLQEYPQDARLDDVAFDKSILYVVVLPPNTPKGQIVASFDMVSGKKLWEKTNEQLYGKQIYGWERFFGMGAVNPERIYLVHTNPLDNSRQITAVDKKNGTTLWSLNPASFGYDFDFNQEIENTIVFSTRNPIGLAGVDAPSGNIIWKIKDVWLDSIIGVYDGVCVGVNKSSKDKPGIYGFELRKGNLQWYQKAESRYTNDLKVVLVKDKLVYHNSDLTKLRVLDVKSGSLIGEYAVPGGEPAIVESKGELIMTYVTQGRHGTLSVLKI